MCHSVINSFIYFVRVIWILQCVKQYFRSLVLYNPYHYLLHAVCWFTCKNIDLEGKFFKVTFDKANQDLAVLIQFYLPTMKFFDNVFIEDWMTYIWDSENYLFRSSHRRCCSIKKGTLRNVSFAKFLRTPCIQNTSGQLRLSFVLSKIINTLTNPYQASIPFLYPLKTSDVSKGYRTGALVWNRLIRPMYPLYINKLMDLHSKSID